MKEKIKRIADCCNLIFTIIATIMSLAMLITSSVAWFTIKDKSKFTFKAGTEEVILYSANYVNVAEDNWEYVWDNGINLEENNVVFGKEYTSPDYVTQLGTIDNLSFRKEINNLWYCLKVKKDSGLRFSSLRLCFADENPYKIFYDLDNTHTQLRDDAVDAKLNELLESLISIDSLIVSVVAPENFFLNEAIPGANENCADAKKVSKYSSNNALAFEGTAEGLDLTSQDYYYIYFRAYPNLDAYADLVDYISTYMPCVMQFNLVITLVVNDIATN